MKIYVVVPAFNEEASIGKVVKDIPRDLITEVIVVNNASSDNTVAVAEAAGATVLTEMEQGYGAACLKGLAYIRQKNDANMVVFIDGDYSDYPQQMPLLINPIINEDYDMVIGSRALGERDEGSMMPQQVFGNWLATTLIKLLYNYRFTDLGPFRAIKWEALEQIAMQDRDYGWTVEMQVKAAKLGMKCTEVPVDYRKRIGKSKIAGTVKGTILAGYKILYTIFKLS